MLLLNRASQLQWCLRVETDTQRLNLCEPSHPDMFLGKLRVHIE